MGIDDSYHVERVLAEGPGGVTELVTLDETGPFVRKRIPIKLARRGVWATLVECDCPRLPHVEATYEMPDEFVVVCDFVPGDSLEQVVAARGRLGEEQACRIVSQLCEAVGALHAHGIVHRDISPTNVVMAADGAHLIDFGIARFRVEGATRDTTQLGTRGFASPEQYGFAQTDARSDVYSLGRLLGYLLTGVLPDTDDYERALADESAVPARLRRVVERASAMEPSARFQSAGELAAALAGEKATAVPAPTPAVPAAERPHRVPVAQIMALAVLALLAAGIVALAMGRLSGPESGEAAQSPASQPSTSGQSATPSQPAAPSSTQAPLEIVESAWHVTSQGYVSFAAILKNTSSDATIDFPTVLVTGRDAQGNVLFTDEQVLSVLGPGETICSSNIAGNGTPPASVDFAVKQPEDYEYRYGTAPTTSFSFEGVREVPGGGFGTTFAGELVVDELGETGLGGGRQACVIIVLRDAVGAIVGTAITFVDCGEKGSRTAFEAHANEDVAYATFEAYASVW